ncbi:MAG: HmuY family protein [Gemmatimonadota bacterium]|nr:HmuY family protein [Gemmatimonadota bacterium]MDQ8178757.1 HmuY family protein [Gemmatimonadota bacterium]
MTTSTALRRTALLSAVALFSACSGEKATGPDPIDSTVREATISAAAPAYVALADGPTALTLADPTTSTAWDLALSATTITTNVGAGVQVACLCGNAAVTNAEVAAMTSANQLAAFNAVTAATIPADSSFRPDVFSPALSGWYTGTGSAAVAAPSQLLLLRRGTTTVTFMKARVTAITGATTAGPSGVTIEYAVQPSVGAAFGATQSVTLANGERFDFTAGAVGTVTAWDLQVDGWNLRLNSGVSGSGSTTGIGFAMPYASLDAATAVQVQSTTFRRDGFASQFAVKPWYRYNVTGTDMQIWPTFNVYLVKRGTAVHKVQLTGYYNLAGEPRNITVRSARLQ